MSRLRPYQKEAIDAVKENFAQGNNRPAIAHATGLGKTGLIAEIPKLHGKRTLVLVHTTELAQQAAEKISRWNKGLAVGIEMSQRYAEDHQLVVVGSVQTLRRFGSKRLQELNPEDFGAIVVDEFHHSTAKGYLNILSHFKLHGKDITRDRMLERGISVCWRDDTSSRRQAGKHEGPG